LAEFFFLALDPGNLCLKAPERLSIILLKSILLRFSDESRSLIDLRKVEMHLDLPQIGFDVGRVDI
jgi:hypothetical protein